MIAHGGSIGVVFNRSMPERFAHSSRHLPRFQEPPRILFVSNLDDEVIGAALVGFSHSHAPAS